MQLAIHIVICMKKVSSAKAAGGIILFFAIGLLIGLYFSPPALREAVFAPGSFSIPQAGYKPANVSIEGNRVFIASGCRALTFEVTDDQALSISYGLEKRVLSRPLTHDVLKDILDNYNISVESVAIDSFEEEIYTAKIFLRQADKVLNLDSRPSDAIALAVRLGMNVKIKGDVLEAKGVNIC